MNAITPISNYVVPTPFLKWAGGKTSLLPELLRRTPAKIHTYAEPFVGAGALFFALAAEKPSRFQCAILSDINEELIVTYIAIRDELHAVLLHLENYALAHRARKPDAYYEVRSWDPKNLTTAERAARLIYLNKTCFNGLWRVNAKGQFNVPIGDYKNPTICNAAVLTAASEALQGVDLLCCSFEDVMRSLDREDFCYVDPPYFPSSKTSSFTRFAESGFSLEAQTKLADEALALSEEGCSVLASNADVPAARELYESRNFRIEAVSVGGQIAAKAEKRGRRLEILAFRGGIYT